jgi:hypothetical protein
VPSKAPCFGEAPHAELGDLRTHLRFGWPIILRRNRRPALLASLCASGKSSLFVAPAWCYGCHLPRRWLYCSKNCRLPLIAVMRLSAVS